MTTRLELWEPPVTKTKKKLCPPQLPWKKKKDEPPQPKQVSIFRLYGMMPKKYLVLIFIGLFFAMLHGAVLPAFSIVFGEMFNNFFKDEETIREKSLMIAMIFLGLGICSFIFIYIYTAFFALCGEVVVRILRAKLFDALLHKDVTFYDSHGTGELSSRLSADTILVQGGISEKIPQIISFLCQSLTGIIVALIYGWKLTLVLLAMSPLLIGSGALQAVFLKSNSKSGQSAYALSLSIAEETFSGFRTVLSFVLENMLTDLYRQSLAVPFKLGKKKAHLLGCGLGFSILSIFLVDAMGFWYGGTLVAEGDMEAGDLLTVLFSILIGMMGLGQAGQLSPDVAKGRGAATEIINLINSIDKMDPNIAGITKDEGLEGKIKIKNVAFAYPMRKDAKIFTKFNLKISPGEKLALVGASGGGKSTTIALLERFYDVDEGEVLIDGVNIKEYNLYWLRSQIGLVSQEPVLFSCSIEENIRFGRLDATKQEIKNAAKQANAHNFIKGLPNKYETRVGEKGTQLSGGQKQRIAIARAILKDPKILLLDEATSALDTESEHLVQEALDVLMKGRTTVIIAHRLATVRDADRIAVMSGGKVVEMGTHDALVEAGGEYALLVHRQLSGEGTTVSRAAVKNEVGSEEEGESEEDSDSEEEIESESASFRSIDVNSDDTTEAEDDVLYQKTRRKKQNSKK